MSTNVHLSPDLERFAKQCVEEGRYNNVSEVVRSALRMLQDAEERKRAFMAMLKAAEDEANEKGWPTMDDAMAAMEAVVAEVERKHEAGGR